MSAVADTLRSDIDEIMPGVIADRRYLHTIPELSLACHKTAAYVLERLRAIGVDDIRTGIAETGITALVRGTKSGAEQRVALIRADMDALPIHEENQVDYVSTVAGAMHACGHDAHTAMLIAIAQVLMDRRDQFSGSVKLLFQPAEELPPGGAKPMIDAGVLEDPHVDAVFGMHVGSDTPSGQIKYRAGAALASADFCYITIHGKGGHGAAPHLSIDPVVVGAHVIVALQTIVARNLDPVETGVVTVGMMGAGEANNVIPDSAELRLTIRAFSPAVRDMLERRVTEITTAVSEAFGATAKVDYRRGYPPTINDEAYTALVAEVAAEVVGPENSGVAAAKMAGEDFSYFLEERPGSFFFVGTRNEEKGIVWPHHHPRFDVDEEGLSYGIETMTRVVMRYLNEGV